MTDLVTPPPARGYKPSASGCLSKTLLCNDATNVTGGLRPPREIAAFNAGVRVALRQAISCAYAIEGMAGFKVTRAGFASEALRAFADSGDELLLPEPARKDEQAEPTR